MTAAAFLVSLGYRLEETGRIGDLGPFLSVWSPAASGIRVFSYGAWWSPRSIEEAARSMGWKA